MRISSVNNNFRGIYLSKSFAPGRQYDNAKEIRNDFIKTGLDRTFEQQGQDILIKPSDTSENEVCLEFVPYSLGRILDDNFDRWNGRFN